MISCEEAATLCNKAQYKETTFFERSKLIFHLLLCKICAKFSKQNAQLTALCDKAGLQSLTEREKAEMKARLEGK